MLEFEPLSFRHASVLKSYFSRGRTRLCDQSMGGCFMWRNGFSTQMAEREGCLFLSSALDSGERYFTVPLGDFEKGIRILSRHCRESGEPFRFCSVGEEDKTKLLSLFPEMQATPTRDWFDYLYLAEKFKGFPGKKLSGQRNHRNFFLKNNLDWSFAPITCENMDQAKAYFDEYCHEIDKDSHYFQEEKLAVSEVLEHPEIYGFLGGMILVSGEPVAISFGEIIGDTLFIHVEKASRAVRGSYQMMLSEFVSHYAHEGVLYVNREEDVGDPGLRYSKEAYHPERLLAKYIVE